MDFDEAIKAHAAWKLKLSTYLKKPDGSLKPVDVEVDNKCNLGQWIYGEGSKLSNFSEYATLKNEHNKFHKAAAEVIRKADRGESITDEIALGSKSAFGSASSAVVSAIMSMRMKAK